MTTDQKRLPVSRGGPTKENGNPRNGLTSRILSVYMAITIVTCCLQFAMNLRIIYPAKSQCNEYWPNPALFQESHYYNDRLARTIIHRHLSVFTNCWRTSQRDLRTDSCILLPSPTHHRSYKSNALPSHSNM
jgi:hypothetical protein